MKTNIITPNKYKIIEINPEILENESKIWEPIIDIEGTAVECHNTLRMPDGK